VLNRSVIDKEYENIMNINGTVSVAILDTNYHRISVKLFEAKIRTYANLYIIQHNGITPTELLLPVLLIHYGFSLTGL